MRNPITTSFFFFNDTATTEIYTLSLHDALPICSGDGVFIARETEAWQPTYDFSIDGAGGSATRSVEHTSELQSQSNLVCRLLLEKKKTFIASMNDITLTLRRL